MKLKTWFGISLVIILFVVGNIILFGLLTKDLESIGHITLKDILFPILYLVMCLILFIFIAKHLFSSLKDQSDILFLIFYGVILCFAITFGATGAKVYYDTYRASVDSQGQISTELNNIILMDDYYSKFISYLNGQLSLYENSSRDLQIQIDNKLSLLKNLTGDKNISLEAPVVMEQIIPVETYIRYEEDNEEREDD